MKAYSSSGREVRLVPVAHPAKGQLVGYDEVLGVAAPSTWAHAQVGSAFVTPSTHDLVWVEYQDPDGCSERHWTALPLGWWEDEQAKAADRAAKDAAIDAARMEREAPVREMYARMIEEAGEGVVVEKYAAFPVLAIAGVEISSRDCTEAAVKSAIALDWAQKNGAVVSVQRTYVTTGNAVYSSMNDDEEIETVRRDEPAPWVLSAVDNLPLADLRAALDAAFLFRYHT